MCTSDEFTVSVVWDLSCGTRRCQVVCAGGVGKCLSMWTNAMCVEQRGCVGVFAHESVCRPSGEWRQSVATAPLCTHVYSSAAMCLEPS